MALQSGATIADRYRLQRHIATGGMGAVWESMDLRLDRAVAVKVLKPEYSDDPEFLERFRAEARTTAKLNHPGIANVYDYGETTDPNGSSIPYLVMELVRGEALNAVIRRMGVIPVDLALDMLEQSGRALHVAHQAGLVHRDVKPGNILVTPTGQVKITDFGIAKAVDAAPVTRTGMVMGTAQYIAPEQAMGQEATAASDVYSLGIVGYEVLGGRRPFQADSTFAIAQAHINDTPAPLPNTIPANVRELIDYTLTKDPAQRYPDGGAFADAVAAVRAGRRPPPPVGASMVAARAADAPATAMISSAQMRADQYRPPVDTGYPDDAPSGMSKGQKNLAITAGILLLLAAMIAGGIVLANLPQSATVDKTPATPTRTTTSAVPTTTRTTPPPRTTRPPPTTTSSPTSTEPTTTRETPTTTRSTTTTTQPTTTEPSTTSTSTSPSSSASSSSATGAMFNIQGAQAPRGATGYSDEMPAGHTPAYDGEQ